MKSWCDTVGMASRVFREAGGAGTASAVVPGKNIMFVLLKAASQVFCLVAVKPPIQTLELIARPTVVLSKTKLILK